MHCPKFGAAGPLFENTPPTTALTQQNPRQAGILPTPQAVTHQPSEFWNPSTTVGAIQPTLGTTFLPIQPTRTNNTPVTPCQAIQYQQPQGALPQLEQALTQSQPPASQPQSYILAQLQQLLLDSQQTTSQLNPQILQRQQQLILDQRVGACSLVVNSTMSNLGGASSNPSFLILWKIFLVL